MLHNLGIPHSVMVSHIPKARQTRLIVSYQCPLPLIPFASTAFQAMTCPLLMAVASQICQLYVAFASNNNDHLPCTQIEQVANAKQLI